MASSSIVRLGPTDNNNNNLSTQLLRTSVASFFQENNDDDTECDNNDDKNNLKNDSRFVIRNKYFSADIILDDIHIGAENQQQEKTNTKNVEDGIILVFDAIQSNPDRCDNNSIGVGSGGTTFDSLHSAHQQAIANNTCGDLLRLCVGVSLADLSPSEIRGKNHEREYSRRILWCLDNGYEYIEADLSEEGQRKGHDDRDKDGFARIVEAIQGTVWSSAAMSQSKSNKLKDAYVDSKVTIQEGKRNDSTTLNNENEVTKEDTEENIYEPPDPSLFKPTQNQTTTQQQNGDTKSNSDNAAAGTSPKIKDSIAAVFGLHEGPPEADREELEAEKLFNKMESVLKEASQIRDASKSGVLSDDERRERAGDAALALVNLMGQFGLDDGDSSSDGYGSDDSRLVDDSLESK